jgi:HAD superfamily hydrolase (TIGR01509 family)
LNLRAAIFDFDGLILETEAADLEAWGQVYRDHGAELTFEDFAVSIGTVGAFDPPGHLAALTGRPVDRDAADRAHRVIQDAILEGASLRPGVVDRLDEAGPLGVKLAIASSAGGRWVHGHLERRGLLDRFEVIVVPEGRLRAKPEPDVYLEALRRLGIVAGQAVAFEDSTNGILAAKAAGIFAVAVPNALTARLDLSRADLRVDSLAAITLAEIDRRMSNGRGQA